MAFPRHSGATERTPESIANPAHSSRRRPLCGRTGMTEGRALLQSLRYTARTSTRISSPIALSAAST